MIKRPAADERIELWRGPNGLKLMESSDPRHLIEDSAVLKHCVGTASSVVGSKDPAHLHYWRKIASGKSRIFTLTKHDVPCITIEYDVATRTIMQMQGIDGRQFHRLCDDVQVREICRCIGELRQTLDLRWIKPFHHPLPRGLYTIDGFVAYPRLEHLDQALGGNITIGRSGMDLFWPALASPMIGIDVTVVPQAHLDQIETCGIVHWMLDAPLQLPRLVAGKVSAWLSTTVSLQSHVQGDVLLGHAEALHAPSHVSGVVSASRVKSLVLPKHRGGRVECLAAANLSLPTMEEGDIRNHEAQSVDLPRLRKGAINLAAARNLTAPLLKHAKVDGPSLAAVDLPVLETSYVFAPRAKKVMLPRFREGKIHAETAATLNAPNYHKQIS